MVNNNHLLKLDTVYFVHYIKGYIVIDNERYGCELEHENLGIDLDGDTITICNTDGLITHYPLSKGFGKIKVLDKIDIVDSLTSLAIECRSASKSSMIFNKINSVMNIPEVESGDKSVFDKSEEQLRTIWDKVNTEELHPALLDRLGRVKFIPIHDTFKSLFSTTYVKDLWKIVPTVKDIIATDNCGGKMPRNLYAVRIALVAWFYHLEGNGRNDDEVKLQEYVNFVRLARNEFYNVDFKINKRKFISGVKRSTTMAQYLEMIKV